MTQEHLLALLRAKKYHRVHTRFAPNMPVRDINFYTKRYGLTMKELVEHGIVQMSPAFKHILVWSCADEKPFTLIVNPADKVIITVLFADDFSSHDWSDKVTPELILSARRKAEELVFPISHEVHVRWLDVDGKPKQKTISKIKVENLSPLVPSVDEIALSVRAHVADGYGAHVLIREKKSKDVLLEFSLEDTTFWPCATRPRA